MTRILPLVVTLLVMEMCGALAQSPYVAATFPQNEAKRVVCHSPVSATLVFPSEAEALDPITFNRRHVHLFALDSPEAPLRAELRFDPMQHVLTLIPRERMRPRTVYVFEITAGLIDSRGFAFLPHRLQFETDDCAELPPAKNNQETISEDSSQIGLLTVTPVDSHIQLDWATAREIASEHFRMERAVNDSPFQVLAHVPASGFSDSLQMYTWEDAHPYLGQNTYRIVLVDQDGGEQMSRPASAYREAIQLRRNLLSQGKPLHLRFFAAKKTTMVLLMRTRTGKEVKRLADFVSAGVSIRRVDLSTLKPGDYMLMVKTPTQQFAKAVRIVP